MKKRISILLLTSLSLMGCLRESSKANDDFISETDLSISEYTLFKKYVETAKPIDEDFVYVDTTDVDTVFSDSLYCAENDSLEIGYYSYKQQKPLYVSYHNYKKVFKNFEEQEFENAGKIYQYKNLRFVNEKEKGVHVFDISDKANPTYKTFFKIPGVEDIVIKDDLLYANSYTHLVTIDISDSEDIKLVSVVAEALENTKYRYGYPVIDEKGQFLFGIKTVKVVEKYCGMRIYTQVYSVDASYDESIFVSGPEKSIEGKGGSMARFAFGEDHLFYADNSSLKTFSLASKFEPVKVHDLDLDWGIETIFDDDSVLFVGSQTGTFIVDIKTESTPSLASVFSHARSCDPIVVEDGTAYVTLSSGSGCWNGNNQLDILDVRDISDPSLIKSYEMTKPQGLAVSNKTLYLCDGNRGLVTYDVTDSEAIVELGANDEYQCTDVILDEDEIFAYGPTGTITYDISDPAKIVVKSFVESTGTGEDEYGPVWGMPSIMIDFQE